MRARLVLHGPSRSAIPHAATPAQHPVWLSPQTPAARFVHPCRRNEGQEALMTILVSHTVAISTVRMDSAHVTPVLKREGGGLSR